MIRRLRALAAYLAPGAGRLTPAQTDNLGHALPSVGYIGAGPVLVIFNLPKFLQVDDPTPTLFDLNAHLQRVYATQGRPVPAWLSGLPAD